MTTRASASVLNLSNPTITDIKIVGPNATIDNTIIGATVPSYGTFSNTTITGPTGTIRGNFLATTVATTVLGVTTNTPSSRWSITESNEYETGSNAGSNLNIARYSDAGTLIDNVMSINRATGVVQFTYAPTFGGTSSVTQVGTVIMFAGPSAPAGYLAADGSILSAATFPALFAVIGYTYGGSGGMFNIPDLRGVFLRGIDNGRGLDVSRVFGSYQSDNFKSHLHTVNDTGHGHTVNDPTHSHAITDPSHNHGVNDPSHNHGIDDPSHHHSGITGVTYGNGMGGGGAYIPYYPDTSNNTTGITINGNATGISINGNATGISITSHSTGIWIANNGTGITLNNTGGNETMPKNVAMLACIKY